MKWKKFIKEYVKMFILLIAISIGLISLCAELDEYIKSQVSELLLIMLFVVTVLTIPLTLAKIRR